ncbi:MAG: hypothetical protein HDS93_03665 [Bacteroidales bacterium]|nr:hypothetical protein [Bacteroidales bacterium]
MKPDTSSYYPESIDNRSDNSRFMPGGEMPDFIPSERPSVMENSAIADEPNELDNHNGPELTPGDNPENKAEWERVVDNVSHLLSWIFVPLLMPLYGTLLLFSESSLSFTPMLTKVIVTLVVIGLTAAIPMLLVILLKKLGLIEDIGLNGRKERLIPYIITIISFFITAFYFHLKGAPVRASMFFAGGGVAAIIELLINFRWKISAHAAGAAGVVAMLIHLAEDEYPSPDILGWIIFTVFMTGALGSARLWLRRHTLMQVLAGYVVGFCSVYLMMMIH